MCHMSHNRGWLGSSYRAIIRISTDGWAGYPEAVDLAFGPYAKFGTIIKEYRNATMIYTPSEMVGTKRTGIRGIHGRDQRTICTSHVERLNGTQRLFMKRLNRLTYCFSKKLENLEAAFAMFAAYYNYCWRTRKAGKSGRKRPTAAMMAKVTGHIWSFDELFTEVCGNDGTDEAVASSVPDQAPVRSPNACGGYDLAVAASRDRLLPSPRIRITSGNHVGRQAYRDLEYVSDNIWKDSV